MSDFPQQLAIGRTGESVIARWLQARGYAVLPVYEKSERDYKGPALYAIEGPLIAPDMLAFLPTGKAFWIEAKTKDAFSWHRKTQRWVTGIDLRNYEDYQRVQAVSPWPVWLLFLQGDGVAKDTPDGMIAPRGLFGRALTYLLKHENHRFADYGTSGMVYWSDTTLLKIADYPITAPDNPHTARPRGRHPGKR